MENEIFTSKFFLGANSPRGFVSRFDNLYFPEDDWFCYILKGGPGTGKSTLMKKAAKVGLEKGIETEFIYCSSDPDSLDAVIFKDIKCCIADGTSPHTLDPVFPGASDTIINLGECWDVKGLRDSKNEVIKVAKENSNYHKRSKRYLNACGAIEDDTTAVVSESINNSKIVDYVYRLSKKMFKKQKGASSNESIRFISGITPKGVIFFEDSLKFLCQDIYLIDDQYSCVSTVFMQEMRENLLRLGYDIISCYCPMNPFNKIDALIVPEEKIGFAVSNSWHPLLETEPVKRINYKRFIDSSMLSSRKQRLYFNKKLEKELLDEAISNLKKAKELHDDLESIYCSYMNYDMINTVTEDLIKKIF